ncbi:hypothetical protein G1C96_0249 [Bifidobacterium sp. DSM 109958]|uniref:PIN domain-containing protein n=1 Tax=Bifidobacterium moraviense TaxID=2675323 RepID=A0A7Y0F236_9BIFI|nr:type II toxin-antitoxin system VapC family toxin [Bifidobacterium sp. DSM 109958]NMM99671.1 hypothetical protein [Bifidobacterium sp. DSM 109958]
MIDYGNHDDLVRRVLIDTNVLINPVQRDWVYAFYREDARFEPYVSHWLAEETGNVLFRLRKERYKGKQGKQKQLKKIPPEESQKVYKLLKGIGELLPRMDSRLERDSFVGHDRGDLFLHSAMIRGECTCLLTNDKGIYGWLSEAQQAELGYEVMTADMFLCSLTEDRAVFFRTLNRQFEKYARNGGRAYPRMVDGLRRAQCLRFADRVAGLAQPPTSS